MNIRPLLRTTWAALLALLLVPAVVIAAGPAAEADVSRCVKVAKAGSRIPVKVCGSERDHRSEQAYPVPGVTPADRAARLDEQFPWLTIDNGATAAGPR